MVDCAAEKCSQLSSPSSILDPEDAIYFSKKFEFSSEDTGTRKVTSDAFLAEGYKWVVDFYPNGMRLEDDQYIALFVTLESNRTNVIGHFELILVDQSGKGKHRIRTSFGTDAHCLMKHQGSQWGWSRFIKRSQLKNPYLKDGFLVVKCRVGVLHLEPVYSAITLDDQVEELEDCRIEKFVQVEEWEDYSSEDYSSEEGGVSLLDSNLKLLLQTKLGAFFNEKRDKFDQYLHAVDEIQQWMKLRNISDYKIRGVNLIQMAMERLLLEFRDILHWSISMAEAETLCCTDCSSCIATSCSQDLLEGDYKGRGALSSKQIYRLRCMSERLNCAGRLQECVDVYNSSRKSVVDARFSRFGIGNWVDCDIRSLDWDEVAKKINFWIRAAQMCFVITIPREKQAYEQIFNGLEDAPSKTCFLVIFKDFAIQLCNFAEIISYSPVLLQKLFHMLELYKYLLLYLPDIKATFQSASTNCLPAQAERTLQRLAELARQILSSFEDTVLHEQLNTPISRGTLHSLTRYTMERITGMVQYNELLTEIITSEPTTSSIESNEMEFLEIRGQIPLARHILWIIISLKFNLKAKFGRYKDIYLGHLFLMNNIHYIVKEIKGSCELLEMIGEEYLTKLNKDMMEEAESFLRSWDKVLFKTLNATFEEIFQTQSSWFVPDLLLREQLHRSILEKVLPAYESFLQKYKNKRYIEKYIKYSPEELHNVVHGLFVEQSNSVTRGTTGSRRGL
ncbi:hypothetical protein AgCh_033467 [Apium graveolens]